MLNRYDMVIPDNSTGANVCDTLNRLAVMLLVAVHDYPMSAATHMDTPHIFLLGHIVIDGDRDYMISDILHHGGRSEIA
jgi:hypothetical protein